MNEGALFLGIKQESKVVSFGYAMVTPTVSHVIWIATHRKWRNKRYATSIVSELVKECLNKASTAIIYVMDDNMTAKSVYSKVGFKPYKSCLYVKT